MNKEVSAEMLLGHLYPELELLWTVRHRGTFYRNYTADVMNLDEEELTIDIARDGLLKLLPPAILTGDFELTKTNADGVIYNIAGQRMNKLAKGINIVNGKKVIK